MWRFLGGYRYFEWRNMARRAFHFCELYNGISPFKYKTLPHCEEEKENTFHNEDIIRVFKCTVILVENNRLLKNSKIILIL